MANETVRKSLQLPCLLQASAKSGEESAKTGISRLCEPDVALCLLTLMSLTNFELRSLRKQTLTLARILLVGFSGSSKS